MPFRPLLAATATLDALRYPLLASPKIDGIRCTIHNGKAYSRTMKLIPNLYLQSLITPEMNGLDGELVVGQATGEGVFQRTTSGLMSRKWKPDVKFCVFDRWDLPGPFEARLGSITLDDPLILTVPHLVVPAAWVLGNYIETCLSRGFEGVMMRDPQGKYKQGRSTAKEGILLKYKPFEDSEGVVVGFEELNTNNNPAKENEVGYKRRSSAKAGKKAAGKLGVLLLQDPRWPNTVRVGSGLSDEQRQDIWDHRRKYLKRVVKYKFQRIGTIDAPRGPIFLGWRDKRDV